MSIKWMFSSQCPQISTLPEYQSGKFGHQKDSTRGKSRAKCELRNTNSISVKTKVVLCLSQKERVLKLTPSAVGF